MHKNIINIVGNRFGRLVVLKHSCSKKRPNGNGRETYWTCKCNCGSIVDVTSNHLKTGDTKSCGCLKIEADNKRTIHGMKKTQFWLMWKNLRSRCNNKNNVGYKDYGGRGITYEPKWNDFMEFKKDMYFKYVYAKKKYRKELCNDILSIERKDVNGNYCFDNCEFILRRKQASNRRTNKWFIAVSPEGKKYKSNHQVNFAKEHNLNNSKISSCLRNCPPFYNDWKFYY